MHERKEAICPDCGQVIVDPASPCSHCASGVVGRPSREVVLRRLRDLTGQPHAEQEPGGPLAAQGGGGWWKWAVAVGAALFALAAGVVAWALGVFR